MCARINLERRYRETRDRMGCLSSVQRDHRALFKWCEWKRKYTTITVRLAWNVFIKKQLRLYGTDQGSLWAQYNWFVVFFEYFCIFMHTCLCVFGCVWDWMWTCASGFVFMLFFIIVFMIVSDLVNDYVPFYLPGDRCCLPLFHRYIYISFVFELMCLFFSFSRWWWRQSSSHNRIQKDQKTQQRKKTKRNK